MTEIWSYDKVEEFLQTKDESLELTEVQYRFLVEQFEGKDTNSDQHIDVHELRDLFEGLSYLQFGLATSETIEAEDETYSVERVKTILSSYDLDHNGLIEFHEFVLLVMSHGDFAAIRRALTQIDDEHTRYSRKYRYSREGSIHFPKTPFQSQSSRCSGFSMVSFSDVHGAHDVRNHSLMPMEEPIGEVASESDSAKDQPVHSKSSGSAVQMDQNVEYIQQIAPEKIQLRMSESSKARGSTSARPSIDSTVVSESRINSILRNSTHDLRRVTSVEENTKQRDDELNDV